MKLEDHLEQLASEVESTAEWRSRKATEYPDDKRNQAASKALTSLAKKLRELQPNNPKLIRLWRLAFGFTDIDAMLEPSDDRLFRLTEVLSEELRVYSFHSKDDGNADDFLDSLILAYEEETQS